MPNHCSNTLIVKGNDNDLWRFKNSFLVNTKEGASYNGIHPMPKELHADTSPLPLKDGETADEYKTRMKAYKALYGADSWYDWSYNNWGTKWDVYDFYTDGDDSDTEFVCHFSSAWAPPLGWVQKAVEVFPTLSFIMEFIEEGMSFCGVAFGDDGQYCVEYGDVAYVDEDERVVMWNDSLGKYVYDDGEVIDDEDFYPIAVNSVADLEKLIKIKS